MTASPTSSTSISGTSAASSSGPPARSGSAPSGESAPGSSARSGMAGWLARLPVRVRLTAWYLGLLAVILATLGSFLLLPLRADLAAETDQVLDTRAAASLPDPDAGARLETMPATGVAGLPAGDTAVQLLSPTGTVLDRGGAATPQRPLRTPAVGGRG